MASNNTEVCLHLLHLPAPDIMLAEVQMVQVACTVPAPPAPPLHLSCTTCTAPAPPLHPLHHPCTSASIMSCTFCTPHLSNNIYISQAIPGVGAHPHTPGHHRDTQGWGAPDPSDDQGWALPPLTPRHHRPVLNIRLLLSNRLSVRGNRTQSRSSCDTPRHHKHRDSTSSCAQDPFVRTKSFLSVKKRV